MKLKHISSATNCFAVHGEEGNRNVKKRRRHTQKAEEKKEKKFVRRRRECKKMKDKNREKNIHIFL